MGVAAAQEPGYPPEHREAGARAPQGGPTSSPAAARRSRPAGATCAATATVTYPGSAVRGTWSWASAPTCRGRSARASSGCRGVRGATSSSPPPRSTTPSGSRRWYARTRCRGDVRRRGAVDPAHVRRRAARLHRPFHLVAAARAPRRPHGRADRAVAAAALVDGRDLGRFTVRLAEGDAVGAVNASGPAVQTTWGEVLVLARDVTGSDADFAWLPEAFLREHGALPFGLPMVYPVPWREVELFALARAPPRPRAHRSRRHHPRHARLARRARGGDRRPGRRRRGRVAAGVGRALGVDRTGRDRERVRTARWPEQRRHLVVAGHLYEQGLVGRGDLEAELAVDGGQPQATPAAGEFGDVGLEAWWQRELAVVLERRDDRGAGVACASGVPLLLRGDATGVQVLRGIGPRCHRPVAPRAWNGCPAYPCAQGNGFCERPPGRSRACR